jgi:protein-S-isoprenylcysteine O-methyltransferase Ste14
VYAGAGLLVLATPVALGSWVGLPFAVLLMVVIAFRALDEEKLLEKDLAGYAEYKQKVRWRLIPGVW